MLPDQERLSARQWSWGIAARAVAAGGLWWAVVATWFIWPTIILIVAALASTAMLGAMIWAAARDG